MKQLKLLFITIFMSLLFNGCSQVSTVKDGTLNIDNSITVGQAFDNYKYFKKTKWEDFETANGRTIVEVKGYFTSEYLKLMKWDKKFMFAKLIVQFKINKDDTFEISAIGFEVTDMDMKEKKIDASKGMTNNQLNNMLQEIYNNKPMS